MVRTLDDVHVGENLILPDEEAAPGHLHFTFGIVSDDGDDRRFERLPERKIGGRVEGHLLHAAIFGINDGLVTNASLVVGVAAAEPGRQVVILAGTAGLVAGAFSMAAGEYISMSVQREMFESQIALERRELHDDPEGERAEVAVIFRAKGLPAEDADRIADHVMAQPEVALDLMAREELGLNPDDLGSPWGAAFEKRRCSTW